MTKSLQRRQSTRTLLARLIDAPELVGLVRGLPAPAFAGLIRHVGVEDAGELVALATTEQLVAAFDEDLFVNTRPGAREALDGERLVPWLEILLEAGDDVAARRVAELSEDFVAHALGAIVLVLDHEALLARIGEGGRDALYADKALESCLSEELDGYLLVSRKHDGWDAARALIVALDRDHRPFLERVLDRCARATSGCVDDLAELRELLTEEESLADDVEAEREERRARAGYVEARAARAFLKLAREPLGTPAAHASRDPLTRVYFRDLEGPPTTRDEGADEGADLRALLAAASAGVSLLTPPSDEKGTDTPPPPPRVPIISALRRLGDEAPSIFGERLRELAYLANVLLAGAGTATSRFTADGAAEAALATVAFGAAIEARERRGPSFNASPSIGEDELRAILAECGADLLFRRASAALAARAPNAEGYLRARDALDAFLEAPIDRAPARRALEPKPSSGRPRHRPR